MNDLFEDILPEEKMKKQLTFDDRKKIEKMVKAGLSHVFIGEMLGFHHTTGKIRGLLCRNCNRALGAFKDNVERLQRAIDYINKHTE